MKNIIFSLIFIVFAGCASPEKATEAPPATAEVVPATEGKIDYDAINKSILKEFCLLWHFLTVCGFVQVACQGFLVREAFVGVLVVGAVFLLSGVQ